MDDIDSKEVSARALSTAGGYSQVYMVHSPPPNTASQAKQTEVDSHEVFFRCGNWSYVGRIQFGQLRLCTADLPVLIPALQKQQGSLRYYSHSESVPKDSDYYLPLEFLSDAIEFFAMEMVSDGVEKELKKMSSVFPWINDEQASTYFELSLAEELPICMDNVALIASKTYTRGLVIISIYADKCLYFVIAAGEGTQALLDVRFPDVSKHGQGLHLASYPFTTSRQPYRKLTLWHALSSTSAVERQKELPSIRTLNVASRAYEQTYCIMKSSWDSNSASLSVHHDVLFRFGSWCYAGRVQLIPVITLGDIPFVIPALRIQQQRLDYLCDASAVPITSPFAGAMDYVSSHAPLIETIVSDSESAVRAIMETLVAAGQEVEAKSIESWLDGDANDSFFEFSANLDTHQSEQLKNIELIASKVYHASGVITLSIFFSGNIYICLQDGSMENPLLDSKFPDVSGRGTGLQLFSYSDAAGSSGPLTCAQNDARLTAVKHSQRDLDQCPYWPCLKKVSVWQTKAALDRAVGVSLQASGSKPKHLAGIITGSDAASMAARLSRPVDYATTGSKTSSKDDGWRVGDYRIDIDSQEISPSLAEGKEEKEEKEEEKNVSNSTGSDGNKDSIGSGLSGCGRYSREGYEELANDSESSMQEIHDTVAALRADEKVSTKSSYLQLLESRVVGEDKFRPRSGTDDLNDGLSSMYARILDWKFKPRESSEGNEDLTPANTCVDGSIVGMSELGEEIIEETRAENDRRIYRERIEMEYKSAGPLSTARTDNSPGGSPGLGTSSRTSDITGFGSMGKGLTGPLGGSPSSLGSGSLRMARPHHLPKMALSDGLSKRMDEIKKSMGDGGGKLAFDPTTGRPVEHMEK